jgi:hypothetical protein
MRFEQYSFQVWCKENIFSRSKRVVLSKGKELLHGDPATRPAP